MARPNRQYLSSDNSRVILKRNGEYIYKEVSFEGARPGGGGSAVIRAVKRRRARSYKYMMDSYLRTSKFDVDEREMPTEKKSEQRAAGRCLWQWALLRPAEIACD